jgi:hypothetical protein
MGFALSFTVFVVVIASASVMARTFSAQTNGIPENVSQVPIPPSQDSKESSPSLSVALGREPHAKLGILSRKPLSVFDYKSPMFTGLQYNIHIPRRTINRCPNGMMRIFKSKCMPVYIS